MSTQIAALFTPGINKNFNLRMEQYSPICFAVFKDTPMTGRVLMRQGWQTYGPPTITLPLNPVHMDEIRQSFSSAYTPIKRTLGDVVAEEDWDDDEYGVLRRVIPARAGAMADIFAEKREYDCANYLAITGFSTATPVPHSPDGVALFSTSHPASLYNNTNLISNTPSTAVDLSHTAYYSAYATMSQSLAPNFYTIVRGRPVKLIYNPTQRAVAVQLARGDWERGLSTFNMNAGKLDNLELVEWAHFRKTGATSAAGSYNGWVLLGNNPQLVFANRQEVRSKADYDINVQGYIWVCYSRYDIGHDSFYDTYASPGV